MLWKRLVLPLVVAAVLLVYLLGGVEVPWRDAPDEPGALPGATDPRLLTTEGQGAENAAEPGLQGTDAPPTEAPPAVVKVAAHEGTFSFHYKQGWSFDKRAVVEAAEADLVFESCAGGISSVRLATPQGGIANAEQVQGELPKLTSAAPLFEAIVRGMPEALSLAKTATGDDRSPASDVFLARTWRGEWVKLAIVKRDDSVPGGWTKALVTIRYELQPEEPVFRAGEGDVIHGGFVIDTSGLAARSAEVAIETEAARVEAERSLDERLVVLDARVASYEREAHGRAGAGRHVSGVLGRRFAKSLHSGRAYEASTYSFEKQTRDDTKATNNDWDFVVHWRGGAGGAPYLDVTTVTDDRSRILDLGIMTFDAALRGEMQPAQGQESVRAVLGHLYLIHTVDGDSDHWILMRIVDMTVDASRLEDLVFEWTRVEDPDPLRHAFVGSARELTRGVVRMQLQTDHGGGNPHRVFLDGTKNAYVDKLSEVPLDIETEPAAQAGRRRTSWGYVEGGYVPVGQVFVVQEIDVTFHVREEATGVRCEVQVGGFPVAWLTYSRRADAKDDFLLGTMDRGLETIRREELPLRRRIAVSIPIWRDGEKDVYIEGASFVDIEAVLRGQLAPVAADTPKPVSGQAGTTYHRRSLLEMLLHADEARLDGTARSLARLPDAGAWLQAMRAAAQAPELRRRLDLALAHVK